MELEKRLFVNLTFEAFMDFTERGKRYEVRAYGRGWTERNVYAGRRVELRKAFSRGSLWGRINDVKTGTLEEIFDRIIDYHLVEPRAKSREEAIDENKKLLNYAKNYIAFEIVLDQRKKVSRNTNK